MPPSCARGEPARGGGEPSCKRRLLAALLAMPLLVLAVVLLLLDGADRACREAHWRIARARRRLLRAAIAQPNDVVLRTRRLMLF